MTPSDLEPRLLSGAFDLALSSQDASVARREIRGVERVDLIQETFFIGLPPVYRLAGDDGPLALAALADEDWILPSTEGLLIAACREAGFEPHIVAISAETVSTRGMIARGLGVGWVPAGRRLPPRHRDARGRRTDASPRHLRVAAVRGPTPSCP